MVHIWLADHYISKPNAVVVVAVGDATSDPHHQTKPNGYELRHHLDGDCGRRVGPRPARHRDFELLVLARGSDAELHAFVLGNAGITRHSERDLVLLPRLRDDRLFHTAEPGRSVQVERPLAVRGLPHLPVFLGDIDLPAGYHPTLESGRALVLWPARVLVGHIALDKARRVTERQIEKG